MKKYKINTGFVYHISEEEDKIINSFVKLLKNNGHIFQEYEVTLLQKNIDALTDSIPKYNESFGDNIVCKCGHVYHRHFDTYDDMNFVSCKYCNCDCFI